MRWWLITIHAFQICILVSSFYIRMLVCAFVIIQAGSTVAATIKLTFLASVNAVFVEPFQIAIKTGENLLVWGIFILAIANVKFKAFWTKMISIAHNMNDSLRLICQNIDDFLYQSGNVSIEPKKVLIHHLTINLFI